MGADTATPGIDPEGSPTLTGTLLPADRRVKRDLATPRRLGSRPGRTRPPTLSRRHHRIGGREVVEEGFVGPRAGRVRRRAEAGCCGRETQVGGNLSEDRRAPVCHVGTGRLDHGDHLHRAPAMRTAQRSHCVDLADQARPRSADLQWRLVGGLGGRLHHGGGPEEAVVPAVAARPIGVPAIEERGLLVGIRDVGAYLGEEVQ